MAEKIDDEEKEKEGTPAWAQQILDLLKPKEQEQGTTEIPIPAPPKVEEEQEDEDEEQPPQQSLGKKMWDWLM